MRCFKYIYTIIFSLLLVFAGCKEITITTKVTANGNLLRHISTTGDSLGIGETAYPISFNSSWTITKEKKPDNEKELVWTFTKEYKNAQALNEDNAPNDSVFYITYETNLEKKFRWIYSYYNYSETIEELGPALIFPDSAALAEYLDKKENMKDEEDWEDELLFESFFQTLLKHVRLGEIDGLTPEIAKAKRVELYSSLEEIDDDDWERFDDHILECCYKVFGTNSTGPFKPVVAEYWPKLKRYLNYIERSIGEDFTSRVEMPGQIIDTNAGKVEGNIAIWDFNNDDFETSDYVMWVESRKMNVLPTVFTAFILLGIIVALFYLTLWEKIQNRKNDNRSQFILNKRISIVLLITGLLVFVFGMMLTISMWNWNILGLVMMSLRDQILFVLIDTVGFLMMLIGGIHIYTLKAHRKRKSGN